ncbi:MAG: hypothetical protein ABI310_03650, partial [Microbacteriaceae bacterium]
MSEINKRRARLPTLLRPGPAGASYQYSEAARFGAAWPRRYRAYLRSTDLIVIVCSVCSAVAVRIHEEFSVLANVAPRSMLEVAALAALISIAWYTALSVYGTRDVRVVGVGVTEYKRVVGASAVAFGCLGIAFLVAGMNDTRGFFLTALPIGVVGLIGS